MKEESRIRKRIERGTKPKRRCNDVEKGSVEQEGHKYSSERKVY